MFTRTEQIKKFPPYPNGHGGNEMLSQMTYWMVVGSMKIQFLSAVTGRPSSFW